jgi:hypothetical protein
VYIVLRSWVQLHGRPRHARGINFAVTSRQEKLVGKIRVHEFTTMDGVIDEPRWSFDFDFGFDPKMGEANQPCPGLGG